MGRDLHARPHARPRHSRQHVRLHIRRVGEIAHPKVLAARGERFLEGRDHVIKERRPIEGGSLSHLVWHRHTRLWRGDVQDHPAKPRHTDQKILHLGAAKGRPISRDATCQIGVQLQRVVVERGLLDLDEKPRAKPLQPRRKLLQPRRPVPHLLQAQIRDAVIRREP